MGGSIVTRDDRRILDIFQAPDIVTLDSWTPSYSVFHSNNHYLRFDNVYSSYVPRTHFEPITAALDGLLSISEPYSADFRLCDIDSLYASRSDTESNRYRWRSFEDFGEWAFHEYLPSTVGGTVDPVVHRERLIGVFKAQIQPGGGAFGSIRKQHWCGRYTARNTGISRRLAACVYLAITEAAALAKPFVTKMRDERLDPTRIPEIRQRATPYVLIAKQKTHAELIRRFQRLVVPVVSYGIRGADLDSAIPHLYCLLNADTDSRDIGPSNRDEDAALHRQSRRLQKLFEHSRQHGDVCDLENYVRHVCAVFTRSS